MKKFGNNLIILKTQIVNDINNITKSKKKLLNRYKYQKNANSIRPNNMELHCIHLLKLQQNVKTMKVIFLEQYYSNYNLSKKSAYNSRLL